MIIYPEINFDNRNDCSYHTSNVPFFFHDIKNVWEGYRTCYSKDFSFFDDTVPKDLEKLKTEVIEDKLKCIKIIKNIANIYGYTNYSNTSNFDIDENIQKMNLSVSFDSSVTTYNGFYERYVNACKWISSKLRLGHESPFEHGSITFTIKNCSRSLTHQLVRHRLASYSQASQRYISENPYDIQFVIPSSIANNPDALNVVNNYFEMLPKAIKQLKDLGIKNEDIRCIYPNAISTSIKVTMNFRELKHFLELRLSKHAQNEIRNLAWQLYSNMSIVMPFIWSNLDISV